MTTFYVKTLNTGIVFVLWQSLHGAARIFVHSIIKNPRFLPNQANIQAILFTHELVIFTKFHKDWIKIVNFSVKAYF